MIPHPTRQNRVWGSNVSVILCIGAAFTITLPILAADYQLRAAPLNTPSPATLTTRPTIPPQKNGRLHPESLQQLLYSKPKATLSEIEPFIKNPNAMDQVQKDDPLLMVAIHRKREDIARLLIERGANINCHPPYDKDWTPICAACTQGLSVGFIQFLEARGAKLNPKGNKYWTLLHLAAAGGNIEVARLLIARGFHVNAVRQDGPPLRSAIASDHIEMVQFLIEKGANVKWRDARQCTLLHAAAHEDSPRLVELLISKGVDVNAADKYGRRPLTIALDANRKEVAAVMKKHGAVE